MLAVTLLVHGGCAEPSRRAFPGAGWAVDSALADGAWVLTATLAPFGVGAPNLTVSCGAEPSVHFGPLIPLIPEAEPGRATVTWLFRGGEPTTANWRRSSDGIRVSPDHPATFVAMLLAADTLLVAFPGTDIGQGTYVLAGLGDVLGARCR
jgi:hypothetical protein